MKKILGLDLGTNSIGWALTNQNFEEKKGEILGIGSRIIPMDAALMGDFEKGNKVSQTADRTKFRSTRRLRERELLRRERLHRVLNIIGFLPEHYASQIDFEKHFGQFKNDSEPKLVYKTNIENNKEEFIFQESFKEMLTDFAIHQPELVINNKKVPYDWTIYFLRKKALTDKIEKEELAWLLLNFNQKRGYFQLRGEDDEKPDNKTKEFFALLVTDVEATNEKKGKDEIWYNVVLENGWIYRRTSKTPLDWKGKVKEFIVTTELDANGNVIKSKDGKEKRSFSVPKDEDWTLLKKKTEYDIYRSKKTVGTYIYETLLKNPNQKIKGKLVRVIERNFYKTELEQILKTQKEFHPELKDEKLYLACIEELYTNNESHVRSIEKRDISYLFIDDIIFYQRPLKSKKSLISDCQYESRFYTDKETNSKKEQPIKCIAKSHPLFQEFRLWQFIHNLRIYDKDKIANGNELDVTNDFLKSEVDFSNLFNWLNDRKEIEQKALLRHFKLKEEKHRWNYVEDKIYPSNKTRNSILNKLVKNSQAILNQEIEIKIWHLLYSVSTKVEIDNALKPNEKRKSKTQSMYDLLIENKFSIEEIEALKKIRFSETDYGSYSEKAIKKFLPLMRKGNHWNAENILPEVKTRIESIIERLKDIDYNESLIERVNDDDIPKQILKSFAKTKGANPIQGLNTYQACYAVYGRHSEANETPKWSSPKDIENYLKMVFKQGYLRNPIVEQVIKETLKVIVDIWKQFGNSEPNFFNEVHIELGREMKNPADKRKSMSDQITINENTNIRIKLLIAELKNDSNFENVRPYSPSQQEILKIYEDGVLKSNIEIPDDIEKIIKTPQPSKSELVRYKLWLEQKYRSPYTGEIIPLSKLFTSSYEIEHIIPQSRYFDDSLSNKVICESEVNKDKDNFTAYEYIKENANKLIELSFGKTVRLHKSIEDFERFVKDNYSGNHSKMKKLLMLDIPDSFVERQLNDTRYISKVVKNLLSNIVREDGEDAVTSKNVISSNGTITSTLKNDWGLNNVWNELIAPRFQRMNEITNSDAFGKWEDKGGSKVFQTTVPIELSKGFNKKRIDHRHHALDALVIACASRSHINYLNNEFAKSKQSDLRYDLKKKLCQKIFDTKNPKNYKWVFYKPWETITQDSKEILQNTIVSFKQNLRVINKTVNKTQQWKKTENGKPRVKEMVKQTKGDNWAVRKPLHDPMPYGKRTYSYDILKIEDNIGKREFIIDNLIREKVCAVFLEKRSKVSESQKYLKKSPILNSEGTPVIFTAFKIGNDKFRKRQPISKLSEFDDYDKLIGFIQKVADLKIQTDLLNHLKANSNNIELAFCPDGLDKFNSNRKTPVYKLPIAETGSKRFALGERIGTKHKWMEATKGTNLFFAVYADEKGNRKYDSIPLNEVIELQKQGNASVPLIKIDDKTQQIFKLLFSLSPNDLVFVPTIEEKENTILINLNNLTTFQRNRVYKFVSCTDGEAHFVPFKYASPIVKNEMGSNNKSQNTTDGIQIKEVCMKLEVDRLGNIKPYSSKKYNTPSSKATTVSENPSSYFSKVTIGSLEQADEKMLMHTAHMNHEERLAYLQKLREITHDSNITEEEKKMNFKKININPLNENS